jgi:hypothetical protein
VTDYFSDGTAVPDDDQQDVEPTTWDPIDLGPYLRGEIEQPEPSVGITRSDGLRLMYPRKEHTVVGETESGKTWLASVSVAAELNAGHHVLYVHFEEPDAGSTVERLRLLGVADTVINTRLRFVGPTRPVQAEWLQALLDPAPSLVVFDGVNEGMALHCAEITAVDGASAFRRRLIRPCTDVGAATLSCDHMPMVRDASRKDAYGSVHKGNALDGARIALENVEAFGRTMRGVSYVFVTKDRPGHLRAHGRPTKTPGKTFMGAFVVDDSQTFGPDFTVKFFAPKDDATGTDEVDPAAELADTVYKVIVALPDHKVDSWRRLLAELRKAGHSFTDAAVRDTVDDLIVAGLLTEVPGKRNATGYRAVLTASENSTDSTAATTASASASPIEGEAPKQSQTDGIDCVAKQSEAVRSSREEGTEGKDE